MVGRKVPFFGGTYSIIPGVAEKEAFIRGYRRLIPESAAAGVISVLGHVMPRDYGGSWVACHIEMLEAFWGGFKLSKEKILSPWVLLCKTSIDTAVQDEYR